MAACKASFLFLLAEGHFGLHETRSLALALGEKWGISFLALFWFGSRSRGWALSTVSKSASMVASTPFAASHCFILCFQNCIGWFAPDPGGLQNVEALRSCCG